MMDPRLAQLMNPHRAVFDATLDMASAECASRGHFSYMRGWTATDRPGLWHISHGKPPGEAIRAWSMQVAYGEPERFRAELLDWFRAIHAYEGQVLHGDP